MVWERQFSLKSANPQATFLEAETPPPRLHHPPHYQRKRLFDIHQPPVLAVAYTPVLRGLASLLVLHVNHRAELFRGCLGNRGR